MSYIIGKSYIRGGFIDVLPESIPSELKQKRVVVEELNEKGDVISKNLLSDEDKDLLLCVLVAKYGNLYLTKKEYLNKFTKEEIQAIKELIWRNNFFLDKVNAEYLRNFFDKHGIEKIKLALELSASEYNNQPAFNVTPKNPYYGKKFTFEEAMAFIESRNGIYYAINDKGQKCYDFIDKPAKKQAQYQRKKHGNRVVFLSFIDWKEYIVSENELD